MPVKLGNGGYSQENYDPNTGKYSEDGIPNKSYENPNERIKLSANQENFFKDSKMRDENGNLIVFHHGTKRKDRVGTYFDPTKATSGPMAFFTDNKEIAESYAENKQDTSLYYEDYDSYEKWFKLKDDPTKNITDLWNKLPYSTRQQILEKAKHITLDDDYENIIYDPYNNDGLGNLSVALRENGGNMLGALIQEYLTDGNLYNNEEKFMDVLKLLDLDKFVDFDNPNKIESGVYDVYLNIKQPFDTSQIDSNFINELRNVAPNFDNVEVDLSGADMWDKNNIYRQSRFIELLEEDLRDGTSYAWTSIPDWVTDFLKSKGYDGIKDTGGKGDGARHTVAIPFYSNQIKNIDNLNPTDSNDISDAENNERVQAEGLFNLKFD